MSTIDTRTSRTNTATLIGRRAMATLADGTQRVGTLEAPGRWTGGQMLVRFSDGTWAHAGIVITLV